MLVALVVPTALIHVGLCFRIIAGEQAIEFLGVAIVLINQRGRVRIVCHVVMKVDVAFEHIADDWAEEYKVDSRSCRDIEIRQRRSARVVWINMDDLCPTLFRLYHIGIGNRMGLGHIAAHNQNSIAIHEILRKRGGATAPQRGTQTGYSGAVSYTGLVLD